MRCRTTPACEKLVELRDGRTMTADQLLWIYYEQADRYLQAPSPGGIDDDTSEVMSRWSSVLNKLERDPMECTREIDWVAELELLQGYRDGMGSNGQITACGRSTSSGRMSAPEKGLFHRLAQRGRVGVTDRGCGGAGSHEQPARGYPRLLSRSLPGEVRRRDAAASWDSLIFDVPGHAALQRVPMLEPLRGTREGFGDLIDRSPDASTLLLESGGAANS